MSREPPDARGNGLAETISTEPRDCIDLAAVEPLTEDMLVSMVRARYEEAKVRPIGGSTQHTLIYTRAGPVIVAVNPLFPVPDLYTPALRRKYHQLGAWRDERRRAPHLRACPLRLRRGRANGAARRIAAPARCGGSH